MTDTEYRVLTDFDFEQALERGLLKEAARRLIVTTDSNDFTEYDVYAEFEDKLEFVQKMVSVIDRSW